MKKCTVDESDPGVEMLGKKESVVAEMNEDGSTETTDLTEEGGSSQNQDTESERDDEVLNNAAQSGNATYAPEEGAKIGETKDLIHEEAASILLSMQGAKW